MRNTLWAHALVCATVSLHAAVAAATPVDDLRAGTKLLVQAAGATIDDSPATDGGHELTKAAGSLAFSIDRSAFGLGAGPAIPVTATELDSNTVELSVNHYFSPVVEHGDIRVGRVVGSLRARVTSLHGSVTPSCGTTSCEYSVRLEVIADGAKLTIEGAKRLGGYGAYYWASFTRDAVDLVGLALGGVPRPSLASLAVTAPDAECAGGFFSTRTYVGRARLTTPASTDGAAVDVESSDPKRLPPFRAVVAPGSDTVTFPLHFGATESGLFAIRASSGGATNTQYVSVRNCFAATAVRRFEVGPSTWDTVCRPCVEHAYVTDFGFEWYRTPDGWFVSTPETGTLSLDALVGGHVMEARAGALGDLAGNLWTDQNDTWSFRITRWGAAPDLAYASVGWSPFVSARGTAFAIDGGQQQGIVLATGDGGTWPVAVPGWPYEIGAVLPSEEPVVNAWTQDGPRAFVAGEGGAIELPGYGFGLRVVAANASGAMVAAATDPQGGSLVLLFDAASMQPMALPAPPGVLGVVPVGMDDDGVVLVNGYTDNGAPIAYLVAPGADPVPLAAQIDGADDVQVLEATSITPGGRIVTHALRDGEPALVLLDPKNEP